MSTAYWAKHVMKIYIYIYTINNCVKLKNIILLNCLNQSSILNTCMMYFKHLSTCLISLQLYIHLDNYVQETLDLFYYNCVDSYYALYNVSTSLYFDVIITSSTRWVLSIEPHRRICRCCLCRRLLKRASPARDCGLAFFVAD